MAHNQSSFTLTKLERRVIKRLAKDAGLSFSNYVRWRLGLEPMKQGGSENGKRASSAYQARKKAEQPEVK